MVKQFILDGFKIMEFGSYPILYFTKNYIYLKGKMQNYIIILFQNTKKLNMMHCIEFFQENF